MEIHELYALGIPTLLISNLIGKCFQHTNDGSNFYQIYSHSYTSAMSHRYHSVWSHTKFHACLNIISKTVSPLLPFPQSVYST